MSNSIEYASTLYRNGHQAALASIVDYATARGSRPFGPVDDVAHDLCEDIASDRWQIKNFEHLADRREIFDLVKQARESESSCELYDLKTDEFIRFATHAEHAESCSAAEADGGVGAIDVDGRTCYVES